ncbi:serine hydrolase domain-containing protein [Marinicella sp. W31]|uniref:serine hydrolase domain-containing protein n=1 Tax=Marinicella sp. W31 TaxID=3023713 RepID=UPI003757AE0A
MKNNTVMIKNALVFIFILSALACSKQNMDIKKESAQDYSEFENRLTDNQSIQQRLDHYKVPGASVAIFENGEIVWRKEYGVLRANSDELVNSSSKFQAASISKAVAALGVIKLVEQYNLNIDTDINLYLKNWKVDYSQYNSEKVTIRRLLSHTAGINVPGLYGYSKSSSIPSALDILNGKGNNEKVQIEIKPGTKFLYSGGGYSILEQLVEDVSGTRFNEYLKKEVFEPLEMTNSSYDLFPKENVSSAHDVKGVEHAEGWLLYPEQAAAGLWSTTSDLVKFSVALENSYHNVKDSLISSAYAQEMFNPEVEYINGIWWGLGVALKGEGQDVTFWHAGSNPGGYRCILIDFYKKKTGIVIMTNSDNGGALYNEILESFLNYKGIKF